MFNPVSHSEKSSLALPSPAKTSGKLVQEDGRTMKVTPHGAGKVLGFVALGVFGTSCGAVVIIAIAIAAGGTGYAVGIPVWYVGAAQANATMILVGKIFTFYGVGMSGLTGLSLAVIVPIIAICALVAKLKGSSSV